MSLRWPRDLSETTEKESEMLYGYPVVYTEDAGALGCSGDLEFVGLDEYHARRISETSWLYEGDIDLFGWEFSIAVAFEWRLAYWGLYAQYLRRRYAPLYDWIRSFALLVLCVGPVAMSVSALRTTVKVSRAWDVRDKVATPAAPEPESPLAGVRHAIYFDAE